MCCTESPLSRTERREPEPGGVAAAIRRPERRSGVRTRGGFGVFLGVTLPARGEGAEEMALSSPAQRRRPSISIRACTGHRIPNIGSGQCCEKW